MKSIILSALLPALANAATTGKFTALSFNVAGLPSILQSNDVNGTKTENAKQLGAYFSQYGYDIINMQEVRFTIDGVIWRIIDERELGFQLPRLYI